MLRGIEARLLSTHGAPDLLINNAGIINKNGPLWQVPAEEFDRLFDVNVKGVANVIRHFVPAMIGQRELFEHSSMADAASMPGVTNSR